MRFRHILCVGNIVERNQKFIMDDGMPKKSKSELIKELKERLDWLTYSASDEEFDENEVVSVVNLLEVLDPIENPEFFSVERGKERFRKYYEQKQYEEEYLRKHLHDEKDNSKATGRKGGIRRRKMFTGTIAAAAAVMVFAIGAGSVLADPDTGFLHLLNRRENIDSFIKTPEDNSTNGGVVDVKYFYSVDEMPDDYLTYFWQPAELPDGMTLQHIAVTSLNEYTNVASQYTKEGTNLYLKIIVCIFNSDVGYKYNFTGEFSPIDKEGMELDIPLKESIKEMGLDIFSKVSEDEAEYLINFHREFNQYFIQGNLDLTTMIDLADEYVMSISNF